MTQPAQKLSDYPDSEEEAVELYTGLVNYFTFRAKTTNLRDVDDIRQDAYMDLIRAYRTYDPAKGTSFKTWATSMVRFWAINIGALQADRNEHNAWLKDRDTYNRLRRPISLDQVSEEWRDQNSVFRDETALEAFDLDDGLPSFDDLVRLVKNERLRFHTQGGLCR